MCSFSFSVLCYSASPGLSCFLLLILLLRPLLIMCVSAHRYGQRTAFINQFSSFHTLGPEDETRV